MGEDLGKRFDGYCDATLGGTCALVWVIAFQVICIGKVCMMLAGFDCFGNILTSRKFD